MTSNKLTKLGDHIRTVKGYAFKSKWYSNDGIPIVKVSDFTEESVDTSSLVHIPNEIAVDFQKYGLNTNDVIIQTVGSWPRNPKSVVGKVVRIPSSAQGALLNQNAVKIIPDDHLDNGFLFYLLKSNDFKNYIIGTAQGAANQASITLNAIKNFTFYLPPIKIQRKIAMILGNYDDLIEVNSKRIQVLEKMAHSLYNGWFVHLRFPGHEKAELIDTEQGPTPKGWEWQNLFDITDVTFGKAFKSKLFNEDGEGFPIVRIRDIPNNMTNTYTTEPADSKYIINDGDILVGMDGDFHMCRWAGGDAYLVQRVAKFRPRGSISPYFLFWALKKHIEYFNATIIGTTVRHLGKKHLKTANILIPDNAIMKQIASLVDPIYELEIILRKKVSHLREVRDLLLQRSISGRIDVSDLDIAV